MEKDLFQNHLRRRVALLYQSVYDWEELFGSDLFTLGMSFLLTARSFLLTVGLCYVRKLGLVFSTCGWKLGLVFSASGGKSVWSFLLAVPPSGN